MKTLILFCVLFSSSCANFLYNPYYRFFRYGLPVQNLVGGYTSHGPTYNPYVPYTQYYDNQEFIYEPEVVPTINLLAEAPYAIENTFTVVPMMVVSDENINMMDQVQIMNISKKKPSMTVKTDKNTVLQCTPAVRIILKTPIVLYGLKTSIVFPAAMSILYGNTRIPIRVGAVIAPVTQNTYVSDDHPISVNVVYAIPTKPVKYDYVNNERDTFVDKDTQAVIVDIDKKQEGQKVPILNFPEAIAEPQINTDDDELVNRNPPQPIVPAGIVQSTQPHTTIQLFTNSKESPFLTTLREESKKRI